MEENTNKHPLKIAIIGVIVTFVGFSAIIPLMMLTNRPSEWGYAFLYLFFYLISGMAFIGIILSFAIGFFFYLILKFLIKREFLEKHFKKIKIETGIIALLIGFTTFLPIQTFVMQIGSGKEKVWEMDRNNDGKIDRWVHDNVYGKTLQIDYDTNLDGKPDIKEYYKNDKLYKKEIDTNFDGKFDTIEKFE